MMSNEHDGKFLAPASAFARVAWEEFRWHEDDWLWLHRLLDQIRERQPTVCGMLFDIAEYQEPYIQLFDERDKGEFAVWFRLYTNDRRNARFFLWNDDELKELDRAHFFEELSRLITYGE